MGRPTIYKTEEERLAARKASVDKYNATHKEQRQQWVEENREELAQKKSTYYQEHKGEHRDNCRSWRQANPEKARALGKKTRDRRKAEIIQALGGVCAWCGYSDSRALQIDHVNGGGNKDRKEHGWWAIYKEILAGNLAGKYQLLCANCNQIKRIEFKEHAYGGETCH